MRVVVSIGGSVLAPDLDAARVGTYAGVVEDLVESGHEVGVVAGGGTTAREYIETARDLGANEIELDELGISVTRLNARLLIAALGGTAAPSPAESLEAAEIALRRGEVAVMGGTAPGHTTDAVGTALAESVGADLIVYATSVPGVFDADPKATDEAGREATKFEEMTAGELVDVVRSIDIEAGSNAPVDLLAAKLLQRSGLRGIVLDGTDADAVRRAIETGDHDGTEIAPES
ncbi:MAG: UMP kinase [Halobacteriales archaeon]